MIPHPASALTTLSARLVDQLVPDLRSEYNMSDGMLIGLLMNALARELESGIDIRMQDIREMQQICSTAARGLKPGELPRGLELWAEAEPANLSIDAVNDLHDSLTGILIELHELVDDDSASDAAKSLNEDIWAYLERHAQRHQITASG